jgi:outer membrane receptor protein involved in Fe transport
MKNINVKHIFIIVMTALILLPLPGQQVITKLQGLIRDAGSGNPIPNVNVYLRAGQKGTASNHEGYFELVIENSDSQDTLVVSCLGYKVVQIPVGEYTNDRIIKLLPEILQTEKEITVYAGKMDPVGQELPHLITVIDADQIQRHTATDISNLFKADPAVHIEGNDLDGRTIQIRGSDPDEVNVYLDGMLINSPGFNNAADLSAIPLARIQKLEILKGSNLILLGSGAFGGVINITTARIMEPEYILQFKYGSSASKYLSAHMNQPLTKRLLLTYYGCWNTFEPQIEYYPAERFETKTVATAISTRRQNHNLTLNYFGDRGQYNGILLGYWFDYRKPAWKNHSDNINAAASYQGNFLGSKNFEFSTHYMLTDDRTERQADAGALFADRLLSQRLHLRLSKNYSAAEINSTLFSVHLSGEYYHDELTAEHSIKTALSTNKYYQAWLYDNRTSLGGVVSFGENLDNIRSSHWKVYAGLRGDFLATAKNYKTSSFGFQINLVSRNWNCTPYLCYGENIKFPSLLENAYQTNLVDLAAEGLQAKPTQLKPELNNSAEGGITLVFHPQNFIFEEQIFTLALFLNQVTNKILKQPLENVIVQTQLGENTTRGVEISSRCNKIFSDWNIILAYEQLDIENPLIYAFKPDKNISARLEYISSPGFYGSFTYFYKGRSVAWDYDIYNRFSIRRMSPFGDLDLILGCQFSLKYISLQVQLAGFNVFDNAGYQYYYLNKRFLQLSLSLHY